MRVNNYNCLADKFPMIAAQWHPTKNGNLTPKMVMSGSNKKVWWKCPVAEDHEWEASPSTRTIGSGCPCCAGKKVVLSNCLATTYPEIAEQWHPTKNRNITTKDVVAGSHKKYWFICEHGHEWQSSLGHRTGNKRGCPYCAGRRSCHENCLLTKYPELAKKWHPTKNGSVTPKDVVARSLKKYWFICEYGHEWKTPPHYLVRNLKYGKGCPYCAGRMVNIDNCLFTKFPEIAAEWHPTKNNLTPKDVVSGSHKKYWFMCKHGHEWFASLKNRSSHGRGCPICNESKGEREIARILTEYNVLFIRQHRFPSCRDKNPLPFDFACKINGCTKIIEYQGQQHYMQISFGNWSPYEKKIMFKKVKHHDKIKRKWCKTNDIPLLEISYLEFNNIENIVKDFV